MLGDFWHTLLITNRSFPSEAQKLCLKSIADQETRLKTEKERQGVLATRLEIGVVDRAENVWLLIRA